MWDCQVRSLLLAMWSPRRPLCSHILKEVIPALVRFIRPIFTGVFASCDLLASSSCLPVACITWRSSLWAQEAGPLLAPPRAASVVQARGFACPRPPFSPVEWVDLSSSFWKVAVRIYTVRFRRWPVRPVAVSSVILCQFFLLGP